MTAPAAQLRPAPAGIGEKTKAATAERRHGGDAAACGEADDADQRALLTAHAAALGILGFLRMA